MCLCATPIDTGGRLGVHDDNDDLWVSCVLSTYVLCRGS